MKSQARDFLAFIHQLEGIRILAQDRELQMVSHSVTVAGTNKTPDPVCCPYLFLRPFHSTIANWIDISTTEK